MKTVTSYILFWLPRILGILFALFISIFALDVFTAETSLLKIFIAFSMHMIPALIIILTLYISWKREWAGALLFTLLGIVYIVMARGKFPLIVYLIIAGPLFLIGILFGINRILKGSKR